MDVGPQGKRARAWKGRSKEGCRTCRSRGKKCDEAKPRCLNCLKGGRQCEYGGGSTTTWIDVVSPPPLTFPPPALRNLRSLEQETFNKFVHHQSYLLGSFYDIGFWAKVVPCVAQGSDQILNATLAVATLYEIPTTGTLAVSGSIRKRYQDAIAWYGQSVEYSIKSGPADQSDISLLLISTILYLFVELRQIETQNLKGLTRTAFGVLFASGRSASSWNSSIVLASLAMLIDVSIHLVDSTEIPRMHRLFAIRLAKKLIAETGSSAELYQLRIELASIVYDVHDLAAMDEMQESVLQNEHSITERVAQWQLSLSLYRATASPQPSTQLALDRLQFLGLMCQVRWEYLQTANPDWTMIKVCLSQALDLLDNATRFLRRGSSSIPDFTLETGFVIACIVIAWHWRDQYVLERIANILKALPPSAFGMSNFLDKALVYIETLINTSYYEATQIEIVLFGAKPKSLLMWQQQRCADYLALKSRGADNDEYQGSQMNTIVLR